MYSGITNIRRLRPKEVNLKTVNDINRLLKMQHSKAKRLDEEGLAAFLKKSKVVVVWNDNARIIGMGILVEVDAASHKYAIIHHLAVLNSSDRLTLGKGIVDLLIEGVVVEFFVANVWQEDRDAINFLTTVGFRLKPKLRYRLSGTLVPPAKS